MHPLNPRVDADGKELPDLPPPTKDLKHRIICAGVEKLIKWEGLDRDKVMLWLDFQVAAGPERTQPQAVACLPLTRASSTLAARHPPAAIDH